MMCDTVSCSITIKSDSLYSRLERILFQRKTGDRGEGNRGMGIQSERDRDTESARER